MEGEKKINGSSYTLFELHPTEHKYVISNSKMGQTTKRLHCILGHFTTSDFLSTFTFAYTFAYILDLLD